MWAAFFVFNRPPARRTATHLTNAVFLAVPSSRQALDCYPRAETAATGWTSFNRQLTYQTTNKNNHPTFAERIAALKAAAETVMLEAQRMEAAVRKFSEQRQPNKTERVSR
jgi:hypothetical protein